MLVVARMLQGMSGAVVWTVGLAMIMDTVGVQNLGKVMGTIFSIVSVGELAAPVLGGRHVRENRLRRRLWIECRSIVL